ncbi:ABC transporter ATP-binding protein [Halomonas piscis]|uniref:ABC transporter ATP-binding protein n=1 Tax=Halomonas piscis TaxID=3031727 RepID=A0ABY9Z2I3_9GAMM|nr:ABC transporter ATP-binding protein [Halomonas piscis]WNK21344.1 ABC transporter ATP-binding protein [Halomonas piscis]
MTKLQLSNVSKRFQAVQALKDVSLELDAGQMLAVLGPSGCGKTTLLRSIAGFEFPDAGAISVDGKVFMNRRTWVRPEKRRVGYVPQNGVLFPHLTVAKNIAFGLSRAERKSSRVSDMLALVGMDGLGERMPHELSGGQQQRVALARALAPAPSLVLLDEPFSALDAGLRAALREEVRTTLKAIGATAIMVTHDQEEALSMADRVAVMRHGCCVQVADPVSLYKYPADLGVARFVGEATLLQAPVANGCIDTLFGRLKVASGCPENCRRATIMLRPEQFVVGKPQGQPVSGRVLKTIYHGHDALIYLRADAPLGTEDIRVRVMGAPAFAPGDRVGIAVSGDVMAYPQPSPEDERAGRQERAA